MKRFVINRHGRIVLPFNFFPERDFSVFETLEQFDAVIKREFEEKARREADIVNRLDTGAYQSRYLTPGRQAVRSGRQRGDRGGRL